MLQYFRVGPSEQIVTSGQSMPIPNAMVAISWESFVKRLLIVPFTTGSVQLWYISTSLNCGISGASMGSVNPSARKSLQNK